MWLLKTGLWGFASRSARTNVRLCCVSQPTFSSASEPLDSQSAVFNSYDGDEERPADVEPPNRARRTRNRTRKRNHLYCWGVTVSGACGCKELLTAKRHARPLPFTNRPYRMSAAENLAVEKVVCGYGFTLFSRRSGGNAKLLGCGLNTNGQLGLHVTRKERPKEWLAEPAVVELPLAQKQLQSSRVSHIACGRAHSLVAMDNGDIFSLGNNSHGQCGRPVVEGEDNVGKATVAKVEEWDNSRGVAQLVCGLDHSLVLTKGGQVYSFGLGTDGQLGGGTTESNWSPRPVGGDLAGEQVVFLASSADTCLAVSRDGRLFGWGNNEYGQLFSVESAVQLCQMSVPRQLAFGNGRVKKAACGGSACLLLDEQGQVWVWGYGLLGLGPEVTSVDEPTLLHMPLFGAGSRDNEENVRVTDVAAGPHQFAGVNSRAELFTWGKNRFGILGLGHNNDQFFPFKVCLAGQVRSVSCGSDHCAAITW